MVTAIPDQPEVMVETAADRTRRRTPTARLTSLDEFSVRMKQNFAALRPTSSLKSAALSKRQQRFTVHFQPRTQTVTLKLLDDCNVILNSFHGHIHKSLKGALSDLSTLILKYMIKVR